MADRSRELVERVQQALASGTPLRIVGNDSKAFMGRSAGGEVVSTATHAGLVEYEPTELVVVNAWAASPPNSAAPRSAARWPAISPARRGPGWDRSATTCSACAWSTGGENTCISAAA
jgi:hypothetical protein